MKISDILVTKGKKVFTIRPDQSIREAIHLLDAHNIGGLVVMEDQKIVGVISERDIIRFAATDNPDFSIQVQTVMTKNVIVGSPQDDLHAVAHTMTEKRFRHLPIMEKGDLVGIITIGDVLKAQRDSYKGQVYTLQTIVTAE